MSKQIQEKLKKGKEKQSKSKTNKKIGEKKIPLINRYQQNQK